ncbi:MAG: hypothetical protein KDD51_14035, partial [Bdellovibrionales bacterium]|nr:hypothetical protein [Bdellovibrionales bacterium]
MRRYTGFIFFVVLTAGTLLRADDPVRPRTEEDLIAGTYARDPIVHVPDSVPIGFSREQFLRDFPELAPFLTTQADFEAFVVKNLSFVGTQQKRLTHIRNTPIPMDETVTSEAITRNQSAGNLERGDTRAGFIEIRHPTTNKVIGLIGVKGIGFKDSLGAELVDKQRQRAKAAGNAYREELKRIAADPELNANPKKAAEERARVTAEFEKVRDAVYTADHSSGLTTLGEAFHELAKQRTLQARFEAYNARHGTNFQTNEVYGVIALPFYVLTAGGKKER